MNSAKVIIILALFLTTQATIKQKPNSCHCGAASATSNDTSSCHTAGCSAGNNLACYSGAYRAGDGYIVGFIGFDRYPPRASVISYGSKTYYGCNCPGYYSNTTYNAYYYSTGSYGTISVNARGYNYATCTDFGHNAKDRYKTYNAIDCCNFCCGRNDPYRTSTSTTTTPPTTTSKKPTKPSPRITTTWQKRSSAKNSTNQKIKKPRHART